MNSDVYNERFARDVRIEAPRSEYEGVQAQKLREAREREGKP